MIENIFLVGPIASQDLVASVVRLGWVGWVDSVVNVLGLKCKALIADSAKMSAGLLEACRSGAMLNPSGRTSIHHSCKEVFSIR